MATEEYEQSLRAGEKYLTSVDPVLAALIAKHGPCDIQPHHNYYEALVGEIIGQQLHVKAAASIRKHFVDLFGGIFPEPSAILEKDFEELRSVGLSKAKAAYIRDLAAQVVARKVRFDQLDGLDNAAITNELTGVKGIGEWTAHMFLMFCMGRLDILAYGDLGIRIGMRTLYGFTDLPTPEEVKAVAARQHWHPCETIACWYVWASRDSKPDL